MQNCNRTHTKQKEIACKKTALRGFCGIPCFAYAVLLRKTIHNSKKKKLSFIKSNGDSHGGTAEQYEAEEPVQQPFGAFDGGCRYQKLYACKRTSV